MCKLSETEVRVTVRVPPPDPPTRGEHIARQLRELAHRAETLGPDCTGPLFALRMIDLDDELTFLESMVRS